MEPKFQSSFIPKGPIAQAGIPGVPVSRGRKSFFGFIATLIFIVAILAALGVFGYNFYLQKSITAMDESLEVAKQSLNPEAINELSMLNQRIISTRDLLTKHLVLTPIFDFLEASTYKNVRFTEFHYSVTEKNIELQMEGQARGYAAVALQSDAFNKNTFLKDQVFSGLDLDDKGNVVFSYSATVDPKFVAYKVEVPAGGALTPPASTPAATTTSAVTASSTSVTATTTRAAATTTATTSKPLTR